MRFGKLAFGGLLLAALAGRAVAADDDPYLWLEDVHGAKPMEWVKQQNEKSLGLLKSDPAYQKDFDAILKALDATDRIPFGDLDQGYVFNFWQDAAHPKGIWRRTKVADYAQLAPAWETLLDLDALAASEHENWVWKGAECAYKLVHCLVSLSRGGGDAVVVREFDLDRKNFMKYGFALPEAKSSITYWGEDDVLVGTDFGPGTMTASGYPNVVKLWRRATDLDGAAVLFQGKLSDVASTGVVLRSSSTTFPLIDRATSFFTSEYHDAGVPGVEHVHKLPLPEGADAKGVAYNSELIFTLRDDWTTPGGMKIAKGSLVSYYGASHANPGTCLGAAVPIQWCGSLADYAVLYTPDAHSAIDQVVTGDNVVYAKVNHDVISSVHKFVKNERAEWVDNALDLPKGGTASIVSADAYGPDAQFRFESYTQPPTLYAYGGEGKPAAIKSLPARFDSSNMATDQFFATSKDGTKIPYFVTRRKSVTKPAPTVLYGYGGFEVSETPAYSANFGMLWLSHGGVYVVANIRGGGEYGPAWHQAALLENRQKAYDDFQAVAEDLIKRGITTPGQLGIMGGSNGGLLVSANMVERPDLFGAVVCQVPLVDMIRYTKIGAGASWAAEYGDPDDPKARAWIMKYSPYQNVKADVKMPPVLFVTATSDDRVTPVHARKMAARMEAQGHDVLFYENTDGGHAAAANHGQAAEMWALSFVYLAQKLGLAAPAPH